MAVMSISSLPTGFVLVLTFAFLGTASEETPHGDPHPAAAVGEGHGRTETAHPESVHTPPEGKHADPHGAAGPEATDTATGDAGKTPAAEGHGSVTGHGGHAGGARAGNPDHEGPSPALRERRRRRAEADSGRLSGALPRNFQTWKPRKSGRILHLLSDVVVGPGQTLVIPPGTEVRVASRDAAPLGDGSWADGQLVSLIVKGGTLRIEGTRERPVKFVPVGKAKAASWGGIEIHDVPDRHRVDLSWVEIPGALVGLSFEAASGTIRHAVVRDGSMGVRVRGGGSPEIVHSVIARNRIAGLHSERSGPFLRGTLVVDNEGPGVRFQGVGLARLENNAFWGNRGGDLVEGPNGTGGWTSDSLVPDRWGNVRADPMFLSSPEHVRALARRKAALDTAPIWKRRLPDPPPGRGPWRLSPFSPLLDRGSRSPLCRDEDGTACDIGLWGGAD
ncbi:MAG: right-handed parallel beta-helix repeat-containing protein [Fibrobacteria bacterium]|nr:right-handed parallel beta-helix repeat-containing protein [Fibrobacteria bacterium]